MNYFKTWACHIAMLFSISGNDVNKYLLLKAFERPSLILDCGNAANPHLLFPEIREEQLHSVYVINVEAIYRFRDALKQTGYWAKRLGVRQIIVTVISVLFSYDDEAENRNVLEHCWEMMRDLSRDYDVYIGDDSFIRPEDKKIFID